MKLNTPFLDQHDIYYFLLNLKTDETDKTYQVTRKEENGLIIFFQKEIVKNS